MSVLAQYHIGFQDACYLSRPFSKTEPNDATALFSLTYITTQQNR